MVVALDATPLRLASGGLRRYAEELSLALAREHPEDDYWLLCDFPFVMPEGAPANLRAGSMPEAALWRRWWLAGVHREMGRRGCELFHGTNFLAPWVPLKPAVVTVHDLSPWREVSADSAESGDGLSESAGGRAGSFVRLRAAVQLGLGLPSMIVTPSEAVRAELLHRFRLPGWKVAAAPLAASAKFRPVEGKRLGRPYFVYAGTAQPRKNVAMLIEAWREAHARTGAALVWTGAGPAPSAFAGGAAPPGIHCTGEVSDEELAAWYSGAAAVVYPSLYEGFGLPVLEAMQCGAVVIASRISSIQEVAGDGAILLDPRDGRAWAEAMIAAVRNPDGPAGLRDRARSRAAAYSWERTARLTREVYLEAVRRWEMCSVA
jgi:glycosyltransferase involved in cell wall biosynthesis